MNDGCLANLRRPLRSRGTTSVPIPLCAHRFWQGRGQAYVRGSFALQKPICAGTTIKLSKPPNARLLVSKGCERSIEEAESSVAHTDRAFRAIGGTGPAINT